jgi:hypothetical protein
MHYLKAAEWEQEWIDTVTELAKEIWHAGLSTAVFILARYN